MFNAKSLQEKWAPVLGHESAGSIKDNYRKSVTAVLLENQERFLREERGMINEVAVNSLGNFPQFLLLDLHSVTQTQAGLAGFDPVLISLIRRAMPNLVAYDICGVQPMSGPTGLIFAMRSRYENQGGEEALFNGAPILDSLLHTTLLLEHILLELALVLVAIPKVTTLLSLTTLPQEPMRLLEACLVKTLRRWAKRTDCSAKCPSASRRLL